jgi:hypothetical protein
MTEMRTSSRTGRQENNKAKTAWDGCGRNCSNRQEADVTAGKRKKKTSGGVDSDETGAIESDDWDRGAW